MQEQGCGFLRTFALLIEVVQKDLILRLLLSSMTSHDHDIDGKLLLHLHHCHSRLTKNSS